MRILIVEDEAKTAAYLRKGLMQNGFSVDVAPAGPEGVALACRAAYDLIVLDALFASRCGWSLLSDLRRAGKQTPVLLMAPERLDGMLHPPGFSELLAGVRTTLRCEPEFGAGVLRVADLEVDWVALRARRGDRRLDLTPKEFLLLSVLARHPGQVLSRALIADQVWGINFDSKTNVVDVHVRRLRAKVDDPFTNKLIHTARGMGYILEDRSRPPAHRPLPAYTSAALPMDRATAP